LISLGSLPLALLASRLVIVFDREDVVTSLLEDDRPRCLVRGTMRKLKARNCACEHVRPRAARFRRPCITQKIPLRTPRVARRLGDPHPAAHFIARALIEMLVDKGFRHRHQMPPALPHVRIEPGEHPFHKPAHQVGNLPARQPRQTRVVDHQRQPPMPLLIAPDERNSAMDCNTGRAVPSPLPALMENWRAHRTANCHDP